MMYVFTNTKQRYSSIAFLNETVYMIYHKCRFSRPEQLQDPEGGGLNLDQTGMCHQRLKFITLFWSGKTQKGYPGSGVTAPSCIVLYCIVLYCIVFVLYLYCICIVFVLYLYCICIVFVLYCIVLHCVALYCIVLYWRQRSCLCFTYLIK